MHPELTISNVKAAGASVKNNFFDVEMGGTEKIDGNVEDERHRILST